MAQIEDDVAMEETTKKNVTLRCTLSGAEEFNNTIDLILYAAMEHVLLSIYCTTIVKLLYAYCERQLAIFIRLD